VKYFCTISAPLNELTKVGVRFVWGTAQDHAFDELKQCIRYAMQETQESDTKMTKTVWPDPVQAQEFAPLLALPKQF
jgi:hypothetical protein